jgi:signal transduction histidine kinase/ligand-binding sensor domain-containing protein/DNA-binding response OmpR family regulator
MGATIRIIGLWSALLAIVWLISPGAFAQGFGSYSDYRFNKLAASGGMSQSSVLCLFQDEQGFIWMGTKDGLNRFDGYSFKVFKADPSDRNSLSNNEIVCINSDANGDLLIGTRGGGLCKYVYKTNKFIRLREVIPVITIVNAIYFDVDDQLWVATSAGLMRGNRSDSTEFGYKFTNTVHSSIFQDSNGNIIPRTKNHASACSIYQLADDIFLVGTENGAFVYRAKESVFRKMALDVLDISKVNVILKRFANEYFIATSDGMVVCRWDGNNLIPYRTYSTASPEPYRLNTNYVNALTLDSNNTIWGGCRGGGLFRIDSSLILYKFYGNGQQESGICDNVINSLLIDRANTLWIGTESQKCYLLDLNRKKINHFNNIPGYKNNINDNLITAITGNQKNILWVGTAANGISRIELRANNSYSIESIPLKVYPDEKNNEIISLLHDSRGNLWIGSMRNSIALYDPKQRFTVFPTRGFVFSIYEDRNRNIWFGTWGNGFSRVDGRTNAITNFNNNSSDSYQSLSSDKVMAFYEDNLGNMWIGTRGGGLNVSPINLLNQGVSSFVSYVFDEIRPGCLSHNDVYCIFQDSRNNIWVGTGNGLNRMVLPANASPSQAIMQGKATFVNYTEVDGLPNNVVYGILEDSQRNLWVCTINGLAKINVENMAITPFHANDGLQDNEFHANAYYKDANGNLFFGGINGISFFDPNEIRTSPVSTRVIITGLKILNQEVVPAAKIINRVVLDEDISTTKKLILGPKHKDFTLEFSGMRYTNMDNTRYAYRLLGFNEEWRFTQKGQHSATYTNILEGDYTFQVKAVHNDGTWSAGVTELYIKVKPTIWRNPWFFLIYLGVILVFLLFFRKYSVIAVKEKNKLRIEAYDRQKAIELTEAKMRFFTNISHEIRTPLTLILSPLEKLLHSKDLNENTFKTLSLVKKNADRLLNLTNQLLELRKIDTGLVEPQFEKVRFIPYLKDILEYFDQQFKSKNITVDVCFDFEESNDEVWIDKEMITTAIYNLISNALKYTPNNGTIALKAYKTSESADKKPRFGRKRTMPKGEFLNIEIADNGVGIPAKELANVFNRFYQASNHTSTGHGGSGIGLSIVKEYVQLHKGTVDVSSQSGKGTTFLVRLPLDSVHIPSSQFKVDPTRSTEYRVELPQEPELKLESAPEIALAEDDHRPLILIAEDDSEMLGFLVNNMSEKYRIVSATNGKQAWNRILQYMPNLIISDIMMPEMDGRELCAKVKSNMETSHIPIILLSAHAANEDIIEGYGQGADRYISKPFVLDVLEAQVNQLLNTRKQLIELYSQKILLKPRDITITTMDEKFLSKIMDIVEENLSDSDFDVTSIVDKMNMSHSSVLKKIKALTGVSLVEFVRRHRLNKAAMILQQDKLPITEVAYMTGFSDPKYFSKCFSKQFGKTPTEYCSGFDSK